MHLPWNNFTINPIHRKNPRLPVHSAGVILVNRIIDFIFAPNHGSLEWICVARKEQMDIWSASNSIHRKNPRLPVHSAGVLLAGLLFQLFQNISVFEAGSLGAWEGIVGSVFIGKLQFFTPLHSLVWTCWQSLLSANAGCFLCLKQQKVASSVAS